MEGDVDPGVEADGFVSVIRYGQVFELVKGVGGVGDQFPQEDLPVGIKGMDEEVQQTAYFGLKLVLCHEETPFCIEMSKIKEFDLFPNTGRL
jgi:hypothetical protein